MYIQITLTTKILVDIMTNAKSAFTLDVHFLFFNIVGIGEIGFIPSRVFLKSDFFD